MYIKRLYTGRTVFMNRTVAYNKRQNKIVIPFWNHLGTFAFFEPPYLKMNATNSNVVNLGWKEGCPALYGGVGGGVNLYAYRKFVKEIPIFVKSPQKTGFALRGGGSERYELVRNLYFFFTPIMLIIKNGIVVILGYCNVILFFIYLF